MHYLHKHKKSTFHTVKCTPTPMVSSLHNCGLHFFVYIYSPSGYSIVPSTYSAGGTGTHSPSNKNNRHFIYNSQCDYYNDLRNIGCEILRQTSLMKLF